MKEDGVASAAKARVEKLTRQLFEIDVDQETSDPFKDTGIEEDEDELDENETVVEEHRHFCL